MRHYLAEIMRLLGESKDQIFTDASDTKGTWELQISQEFSNVTTAKENADQALADARAKDVLVNTCDTEEAELTANHSLHCGDRAMPEACVQKNNTRFHNFKVARKDTWKCNFTHGSTPTTCTAEGSPLKEDLRDKDADLVNAYRLWKMQRNTCNEKLQEEHELCQSTNGSYTEKKEECRNKTADAGAYLCRFREKIAEFDRVLTTLKSSQENSRGLLAPKQDEWADLNVISCLFEKFSSRDPMVFHDS